MRKRTCVIEESGELATTSSASFEDVNVALSPVAPINGQLNTNRFFNSYIKYHSSDNKNFNYEQFATEIAASNPDMVHFQQVLNNWVSFYTFFFENDSIFFDDLEDKMNK